MNEDWWEKLKSETFRDRLPGFFIIVSVGVFSYFVLLGLILLFLPWRKEPQHTSAQINPVGAVSQQTDTHSLNRSTLL